MPENNTDIFYPTSLNAWRDWLAKNHATRQSIRLVFYKKSSGKPTLTWSEAVDVALCYGWIDSKKVAIDQEQSHQFFSKRKTKSTWSKINKDKANKLIDAGLMTQAGLDVIDVAKKNGSWTLLDEVEQLIIPEDLEKALKVHQGAQDYFLSLSKSVRKMMLQWLVLAKRPETRQRRIQEIAELAAQGLKPKQF